MIDKNTIPKHWEIKKLGEVCTVVRGGSPRPMGDPKYFSGTIPFLKIADITKVDGKFVFDAQTKVNELGAEKSRLLKKGSLILSNSATVCVPKFLGVDACIHDGFVSFQNFIEEVNLDFLFHYFNNVRPSVIQKNKQGVTQVNLNIEIVSGFELPLPPLAEQQEIVAKIEELLSELDKGKEQLETAQQQLKVYRQAVLKWAFEGRLTNEGVKEEELPKSWKWLRLKDVAKDISDGDHQPPPKSATGVPFITISNVNKRTNKIDFSDTFTVSEEYYQNLKETRKPIIGDILYTVTGSFGIPVLVDFEKEFCFQRHIGLIRPLETTNQKWLYYLLQSPTVFHQAEATATGTAQKTVSLKLLRNFNIPVAGIEEQKQIVQEIESRLSVCDKVEETIVQSLQQTETLRQSILKQAFEGRLLLSERKSLHLVYD